MRSRVYFLKLSVFVAFATIVAMFSACKPRVLPSTNVPPTRDNKKIVAFLEQYKSAVEKRSVEAIMELVSRDFSDHMGSENPPDTLDYLKLKERLAKTMPRILDLRLGMFVQHIEKRPNNMFEVVFYFNKHILMEVPSGEKWVVIKEVSRIFIRRRNDKNSPYEFEIVSGI